MAATAPQFRVISIGTLAAHPLWNEKGDVRTGHTTTTLIETEEAVVLVDPGLPAQALAARLHERSSLTLDAVTHVFLTSFDVDHIRGLPLFAQATWLLHEPERGAAAERLEAALDHAEDDADIVGQLKAQASLLARCRVADDSIAAGIDLFPLPGVTPGTCGLLLPLPTTTILIAGDAVPTVEHLERGQVLPWCDDRETAQESFKEAIEIADVLVPGRDNVVVNPLRRA